MSNPRKEFIYEIKRAIAVAEAANQDFLAFELHMKLCDAWNIDPGFDRKPGELYDDDFLNIDPATDIRKPSSYIPKI